MEVAMAMAVAFCRRTDREDVLRGSELVLEMFDSGQDPVQAASCVIELIKKGVVAIVGPKSSSAASFASYIGRASKIPLVSFGATDPNLSEMQYPYLIRVVPSDVLQMDAIASFVANYGWKEVVMFHMDDDYGTNGASSLSDSLQARGMKLVEKVPIDPWIGAASIGQKLEQLMNQQTRVFVLHAYPEVGLAILQEAYNLNMVGYGYVWIATDQITISLEDMARDPGVVRNIQGIIGIRPYIPPSLELQNFFNLWNKNFPTHVHSTDQINPYALYAYDAVWTIAYAVSSYLKANGKFNFLSPRKMPVQSGGKSELSKLKVLETGDEFKEKILGTQFLGTSGLIRFDKAGDRIGGAFEYINIVGRNPHGVGYWWANRNSISLSPPSESELLNLTNFQQNNGFLSQGSSSNATKMPIIWPGGVTDTPRGWALPKDGNILKIGVPRKAGYTELVSVTTDAENQTIIDGFCIQVFKSALSLLPYDVPYEFELLGDGVTTPKYSDLIQKLANQEYDAVVGDVAILADRLRIVDFTQPYIESGLVVLVPVKDRRTNSPWAFLTPFTSTLWCTVLLSFIFTGVVIWMLEHNVNEEFRGTPSTQVVTVVTFIFSTLFFTHKEETRTFLGRFVLLVWLFVILIINSSYTANLTSILTVQQLTPAIKGLESLIQSNLPIGYQTGSFVRDYLINLNVSPGRLKDLESREMYERALNLGPYSQGGVAAIVDELPYVQLLQAANCQKYTIAGQEFTKSGWGFAFPRGSDVTADLSQAILQMSQSGELQRIKDYWFKNNECQAESSDATSNQLDIGSFWGLFLISGVASVLCVAIHIFIMVKKYKEHQQMQGTAALLSPHFVKRLKEFIVFADKHMNEKKKLEHSDCSSLRPCPHCGNVIQVLSSSSLRASTFPSLEPPHRLT